MRELYLMVTIVTRSLGEKYLNFYLENHMEVQLVTLGRGTASDATLDYFGLESHDKAVLFSIVTDTVWRELRRGLRRRMQIEMPGTGVAFLIPLSSMGGRGMFTYLTKNLKLTDSEGQEERRMEKDAYEMIVAVANQGYTEPIMEAARSANAGGGTVIHAKGTGMEGMGKFFGVSLAAEKEMIFIVAPRARKNEIMRAIMEKAGMESKARTFLFSVPVSDVAGMAHPDEE